MIDYIKGNLAECTPTYAVIDCNGVGYLANISLTTYTQIKDSQQAHLLIHEAIREDAYNLYGFSTLEERTLFRLLISVSGIGANTARMILSAYPTAELRRAIMTDDVNTIKSIKGIGLKTAQRLLVELRDKMSSLGEADDMAVSAVQGNKVKDEALAALEVLGFTKAASTKVVDKILKDSPDLKVEGVVKMAIKML